MYTYNSFGFLELTTVESNVIRIYNCVKMSKTISVQASLNYKCVQDIIWRDQDAAMLLGLFFTKNERILQHDCYNSDLETREGCYGARTPWNFEFWNNYIIDLDLPPKNSEYSHLILKYWGWHCDVSDSDVIRSWPSDT